MRGWGDGDDFHVLCEYAGYRLFRIPFSVSALQNVQRDFQTMDSNLREWEIRAVRIIFSLLWLITVSQSFT